jgi:twitching motility protein PilT
LVDTLMVEFVRIDDLLALARDRNASDLHLGNAGQPTLRIHGKLTPLDVPALSSQGLEAYLERALPTSHLARWQAGLSIDVAQRTGPGAPYRLHAYRSLSSTQLAFRLLHAVVPPLADLDLPEIVRSFVARRNGLVLMTGPTGSGKTTALAALIGELNRSSGRVVVTIEDPVEFIHVPARSLIAHCEIGRDVARYESALRGFMRADPDVILIGEMRDRRTMSAALTAAETGHLVLSSLHTNDASQTVDRIVDAFPSGAQSQVRTQLAATLIAITSLRLVPRLSGNGRVAAAEVLIATDAVRAMIRDGKTHQLRNAIATGRASGMRTLEASLSELVLRGTISIEAAREHAGRPADVRDLDRAAG